MKSVKDFIPLIIATVIALFITLLVRFVLPGGSIVNTVQKKTEVSMPDIPLMVKESEAKFVQVLFVTSNIEKGKKITQDKLSWKKWPEESLQPYFIAKTDDGVALNNSADYDNALMMFAKTDIPQGTPLTVQMLTNEDPVAKLEKERQAKLQEEERKKQEAAAEEERRKAEEKEKEMSQIAKGMRAVTFQVDQKNAISSGMLFTGDLIDVLIMENRGSASKMHKYKAIKLLAIDGVEKKRNSDKNEEKSKAQSSSFISNISSFVATAPKNVTLEIKEHLVETMLRQSSDRGIIILLRNSEDDSSELEEITTDQGANIENDLLYGFATMHKVNSSTLMMGNRSTNDDYKKEADALLKNMQTSVSSKNTMLDKKRENDRSEREIASLIRNMGSNIKSSDMFMMARAKDGDFKQRIDRLMNGSKIEFVSGKAVGNEPGESTNKVTIYRKLTPNEIVFDDDGKKVNSSNDKGNMTLNDIGSDKNKQ